MDMNQTYQACVAGLQDFTRSIGCQDVVVGLSGGIDSSVVATLCVQAFGAEHVHGVLMPGPYSSDHSLTDAQELVERLGIDARTASIKEPFLAFDRMFHEACGEGLAGVAAENTQARCRMIVLMALSNQYGWMVVNTGNKSEAMMGYSTLYGDTAGAYAPIGGLYKTQVFELARWLNAQAQTNGCVQPVPQHVIEKPPSAELSAGQEDEKSLGVTYEVLDRILIRLVEWGMSASEVAACGFDASEVKRIEETVRAYAFKRALEPAFPSADFYAR